MTKLTWKEAQLGPVEMWVEGNTARNYEAQGFIIVEYEPPPRWLQGCYSGRAKIRKPGSEYLHVWSPELASLHKFVCEFHSKLYDGISSRAPTWQRLGKAHTLLFNDYQYHEKLMWVEKYSTGSLEEIQNKIVQAIKEIASKETNKKAAKLINKWAEAIVSWDYNGV